MTACPAHRPRLRRLWLLPTVRTAGAVGAGVVALAAGLLAWPWASAAVVVLGAAGVAVHVYRNRSRVVLERRLLRALKDSAPCCPGDIELPGLSAPVRAECSADGVTRLTAQTYHDAVRALGHVMGRDRGFQLDLIRRSGSGRLAEVWGRAAVPADTAYRRLGLAEAARTAAQQLAEPERELLTAFAEGVNAAFALTTPFECRFLSYRPQPWRVEDSVLTALVLFHSLSWNEPAKRAEAIVRRALPAPVADFLLADSQSPAPPADLARHRGEAGPADLGLVDLDRAVAGSNCWVAGKEKQPLLACDLHLGLGLPNALYEVDLPRGRSHAAHSGISDSVRARARRPRRRHRSAMPARVDIGGTRCPLNELAVRCARCTRRPSKPSAKQRPTTHAPVPVTPPPPKPCARRRPSPTRPRASFGAWPPRRCSTPPCFRPCATRIAGRSCRQPPHASAWHEPRPRSTTQDRSWAQGVCRRPGWRDASMRTLA